MDAGAVARTDHGAGKFDRVLRFPLAWLLVGIVGVGGVSALTSGGPPALAVGGAVAAVAVYQSGHERKRSWRRRDGRRGAVVASLRGEFVERLVPAGRK